MNVTVSNYCAKRQPKWHQVQSNKSFLFLQCHFSYMRAQTDYTNTYRVIRDISSTLNLCFQEIVVKGYKEIKGLQLQSFNYACTDDCDSILYIIIILK